jgi:tetratricopeptide (TPR) repeat protein
MLRNTFMMRKPSFEWSWKFGLALLGAGLLSCFVVRPATAQITTQMLIGDAVSDVGNRYPDVDKAIQRFSNRDFLGARLLLEDAKRKDPSLPPTDLTMAKLYSLSGDEAAARNALEATVLTSPEDPEVFLIVADSAVRRGRTIEAEALYDKALELTGKFSENQKRKRNFEIRARNGRAAIAERRKNWSSAVTDLQALLKVDPDNATAHYRLGAAMFMLAKTAQQYGQAFNEFKEAKRLDKDNAIPNPYVSAALWYDQLGNTSDAGKAFARAVADDPKGINTLASYAQWLIKTGNIEQAEKVLADARKADPSSLEILTLSGVAARMANKPQPAEDYFLQALNLSPSNSSVLNQLALLLIGQEDKAKKERALQFALINSKLQPQSPETKVTLSWVLYQLDRLKEADAAFRDGLRLGMGNLTPDSNYLVAKMLVDRNQGEAAKQLLTKALDNGTSGIFVNRQDAQALLSTLDNK